MIVKISYKLEQNETEKVKKAIKDKHLSLRKIAPQMNITATYLQFLINSKKWFSQEQINILQSILEIKI